MKLLSQVLNGTSEYQNLCDAVDHGRFPLALTGLYDTGILHTAYCLCARAGEKALFIAASEAQAQSIYENLQTFYGDQALLYPYRDFNFQDVAGVSREFEHKRLGVLERMLQGRYQAVVTVADAAMQFTIDAATLKKRRITLRQGTPVAMERILAVLADGGYERTSLVEGAGQFSVRGGILDFFSPQEEYPVRVEFFGDEPDLISYFDPLTQRRIRNIHQATIIPAVEVAPSSDQRPALAEQMEKLAAKLEKRKTTAHQAAFMRQDAARVQGGLHFTCIDRYLNLIYTSPQTLLDYFGAGYVFLYGSGEVGERVRAYDWQVSEDIKQMLEQGIMNSVTCTTSLSKELFFARLAAMKVICADTFLSSASGIHYREICAVTAKQIGAWSGRLEALLEDIRYYSGQNYQIVLLGGTERGAKALCASLEREGITALYAKKPQQLCPPGQALVITGSLSRGFEYPAARFALMTQRKAYIPARKKRAAKDAKNAVKSFADIKPGDYVVHVNHGIGVYEGIHKLELDGVIKDYIKIKYSGADKLYVPVSQLDMISKYIGVSDVSDMKVKLNKLSGSDWQKTKARVRAGAKDLARDLIAISARRQHTPGIAFDIDTPWQREFEERFEYDETEDQLRAIREIKHDMEKPRPMDRLLCGDVGFGKTEVAVRAAFKCVVSGGKQCAVLVPTTILSWQHYQTFSARMRDYPVKIDFLSRFKTAKEQKETLRRLARGEIDIIIGTHRIIQKDVKFKDLGLLIIDEEQRFGVAHKEKIKQMAENIDVLTLSATPIPRTLNMALMGIRDISMLEQAPGDRYGVQTYVLEHDWGVIAAAITRELSRGGQVYYLHNRIESISRAAAQIQALVPEARIASAHGRMSEQELTRVWQQMNDAEIDVLVCTTLIENGIDISNANTLIVEDCENMGLAQLHQLRGRVGRSSRRAFAYFTYPKGKALNQVMTQRLAAVREYTEFGSGLKIAMRDLEIRGAGNILGAQQHGHMESVGYDLYLKILEEAVGEIQGVKTAVRTECAMDLFISAYIPDQYIEDAEQRVDIYKKIAATATDEDQMDITDELCDRFGEPPEPVQALIRVAMARNLASSLGFTDVVQGKDNLVFYPGEFVPEVAASLAGAYRGAFMANAGSKPYYALKLKKGETALDKIEEFLRTAANIAAKAAAPAAKKDAISNPAAVQPAKDQPEPLR